MNSRQIWTARGGIAIGLGGIATVVLSQAIIGTLFFSNLVGVTSKNTNPSFIVDQASYLTPIGTLGTECTATGGLSVYDTCRITSPFASDAASRGLRTGTGVVTMLVLEIVANPNGASIDVTKAPAINTATGGTVFINNASATGTVVTYSTPFTLGPTEIIKAATLGNAAGLELNLRGIMLDTGVTQ